MRRTTRKAIRCARYHRSATPLGQASSGPPQECRRSHVSSTVVERRRYHGIMHNCSILLIPRVEVTEEKKTRYSRMQKAQAMCKIHAIAQKAESNHVWINLFFFTSNQAREKASSIRYSLFVLFIPSTIFPSQIKSKSTLQRKNSIYVENKLPVERHEVIAEQGEPP